MTITATQIRELREKTGAGMMDCKRALERSEGDQVKAAAVLKELGLVQAKKREDREMNEGRVFLKTEGGKSVILNLGCETDFVAKTGDFVRLGEQCLELAFSPGAGTDGKIQSLIDATALRIREHIALRGLKSMEAGPEERLVHYVHGEGKIGVTIRIRANPSALYGLRAFETVVGDLALHAAAFAPMYLAREDIDPAFLEIKRAEFTGDLRNLGKPEAMIGGIVRGKLEKFMKTVCFLEQPFVKDEKRSVRQVLDAAGKELGGTIALTGFIREAIGPSQ